MAKTLRDTILHNYTYEKIRDLCFTEGSNFGNVFDCDWGVWRDKAVVDFGVSPEFFDLVKTLSGPQRYLQIASYVKLTPLSGVRVYKDTGVIEGVYEAYAGYVESHKRKNIKMMSWFYNRLNSQQKKALGLRNTAEKQRIDLERLQWIWEKKARKKERIMKYGFGHLARVIETGNLKNLDSIIHNYFTLPQGFSIEKDMPKIPFWEPFVLQELPLQNTSTGNIHLIMKSAVKSGDTRIVDFFRSIFRDRDIPDFIIRSSEKSLTKHGKPEEAYGIVLRFLKPQTPWDKITYMVELALFLTQDRITDYTYFIDEHLGNITYLQALLPFVDSADIERVQTNNYLPLSRSLIEEYTG